MPEKIKLDRTALIESDGDDDDIVGSEDVTTEYATPMPQKKVSFVDAVDPIEAPPVVEDDDFDMTYKKQQDEWRLRDSIHQNRCKILWFTLGGMFLFLLGSIIQSPCCYVFQNLHGNISTHALREMGTFISMADTNSSDPCLSIWNYSCGSYHRVSSRLRDAQQADDYTLIQAIEEYPESTIEIAYRRCMDADTSMTIDMTAAQVLVYGYDIDGLHAGYLINPYTTENNTVLTFWTKQSNMHLLPEIVPVTFCGFDRIVSDIDEDIAELYMYNAIEVCSVWTHAQGKTVYPTVVAPFVGSDEECALLVGDTWPLSTGIAYAELISKSINADRAYDAAEKLRQKSLSLIPNSVLRNTRAKTKLEEMKIHIGWTEYGQEDADISTAVVRGVEHIQQVFLDARRMAFYAAKKMTREGEKGVWGMSPWTVNAYYSPSENSVYIPYGLFVLVQNKASMPVYAGSFLSIVAHEIMHAIDVYGIQFDEHGVYDPEGLPYEYANTVQCMRNAYPNGNMTITEDMADRFGMELLSLYILDRSEADLFVEWAKLLSENTAGFVKDPIAIMYASYAQTWCTSHLKHLQTDVHSSAFIRVMKSASNDAEFQKAYGCTGKMHDNIYVDNCEIFIA